MHEGGVVWGISAATHAQVARAEVALWVVFGADVRGGLFDLAEPRALGAVGRDEDPLGPKRVETAVRMFVEMKVGYHQNTGMADAGALRDCIFLKVRHSL